MFHLPRRGLEERSHDSLTSSSCPLSVAESLKSPSMLRNLQRQPRGRRGADVWPSEVISKRPAGLLTYGDVGRETAVQIRDGNVSRFAAVAPQMDVMIELAPP